MMEGLAAVFAGMPNPRLDPRIWSTPPKCFGVPECAHYPAIFTCLFGDEAARSVGYPPFELSPRAGLAWRTMRRRRGVSPEDVLLAAIRT
jgi:hypothetical protein